MLDRMSNALTAGRSDSQVGEIRRLRRPNTPHCKSCQIATAQRKLARRRRPDSFGYVTCDHTVAVSLEPQGLGAERDTLVIMGRGTRYIERHPLCTKTSRDGQRAFQNFIGPDIEVRLVHRDAAQVLIQAMDELQIRHQVAAPYRPHTNGVALRTVRMVMEASRTAVRQAGLPPCFWPYASTRGSPRAILRGSCLMGLSSQRSGFRLEPMCTSCRGSLVS